MVSARISNTIRLVRAAFLAGMRVEIREAPRTFHVKHGRTKMDNPEKAIFIAAVLGAVIIIVWWLA